MPSNEGLREQYYITKLRLRIVIAVEQKFISELLTSRSENRQQVAWVSLSDRRRLV